MTSWIIRFTVTWTGIDKALGNSLTHKEILGLSKNIVNQDTSYLKQIDADKWETLFVKGEKSAIDYFYNRVFHITAYSSIPFAPEHIRNHMLKEPYTGKGDWKFKVDEIGSTDLPFDYVMENYHKVEYDMFDLVRSWRKKASYKDKKK